MSNPVEGMCFVYEDVIEMFKHYPIGKLIQLKDDYPNEINTVADYESSHGEWYLKLSNGIRVNIKRLEELEL